RRRTARRTHYVSTFGVSQDLAWHKFGGIIAESPVMFMPALEPLPGFWHNGGRLRVKEYAVKPLFALFWQICRFRRGPEDVPFAPALMAILLLAVAGLGSLSIVILSGVEQPRPEQDVAVSTQLM